MFCAGPVTHAGDMAGIDDVLERLVTDPAFRKHLRDDPQRALEGYVLSEDDLALLTAQLDDRGSADHGADHGVAPRASSSGLFGPNEAETDARPD
jgi:hypothetical protein